jgi:nicotinamide-nucleotide amidase
MSLSIAVLTIGDELLDGSLSDSNTARIAALLGAQGLVLRESLTIGDREPDIISALLGLVKLQDVVIVTGGLGPTADDLTARAAAKAFNRRLVLNDEALQQIREYFLRQGREMHPRNEKQALMPQKVMVMPNRVGTAPGFILHQDGHDLFFLPGVPAEMIVMLEEQVLPHLRQRSSSQNRQQERVLRVFGLSEPKIEALIEQAGVPEGLRIAFGVEFPFVLLKLRASGEAAHALLEQAEQLSRQALGDCVVARGSESLAAVVGRRLTAAGQTLALAESCTGGLVSSLLTEAPGASAFLQCSAVVYANRAKQDILGVTEEILERDGAVSEACALAMAQGVRQRAGSDLALAITGIAGPEGGSEQKPVGTVYLALCGEGLEQVKGYRFGGTREQIRLLAANMALDWIRRHLNP